MGIQFSKEKWISIRKKTQKIKKLSDEYKKEAETYFKKPAEIRSKHEDILYVNFDEVNLPFEVGADYTIDQKGASQVPILSHTKAKESCTFATGITSDGDILLPLVIFKYKPQKPKQNETNTKKNH